MGTTEGAPQAGLRFVYVPARDLDVMRTFYTDEVGLHEIYHSAGERVLAYDCDGLQFTIFESPDVSPAADGWATQPGWSGDTSAMTSWSVVLDERAYRRAVERLRSTDVPRLHDVPVWIGYWSFPVRDPMGTTVELSLPIAESSAPDWATHVATSSTDAQETA